MNDLPLRLITALVLGLVVISGIYYSDLTFGIILLIIGYFSSTEYLKLALHGAEINNPVLMVRLAASEHTTLNFISDSVQCIYRSFPGI